MSPAVIIKGSKLGMGNITILNDRNINTIKSEISSTAKREEHQII
jgi:hypothetical protein